MWRWINPTSTDSFSFLRYKMGVLGESSSWVPPSTDILWVSHVFWCSCTILHCAIAFVPASIPTFHLICFCSYFMQAIITAAKRITWERNGWQWALTDPQHPFSMSSLASYRPICPYWVLAGLLAIQLKMTFPMVAKFSPTNHGQKCCRRHLCPVVHWRQLVLACESNCLHSPHSMFSDISFLAWNQP